jgi:hypothetical protein
MASSLTDVRAEEVTRLTQVVDAAKPALEAAQEARTAAEKDVTAEGAALAALQAAASTLDQQRQAAKMAADQHAFELALEENQLAQRATAARLATATALAAAATRRADRIIARRDRAVAQRAVADADLARAEAADQTADQWRAALAPGGAAAVAIDEAGGAAVTALVDAAGTRLTAELGGPALLELTRGRQRAAAAAAADRDRAVENALAAVHAVLIARAEIEGDVAHEAERYEQARADVRLVAENAPADLAAARAVLAAARDDPAPSGDVLARIAVRATDAEAAGAVTAARNLTGAIVADLEARAALEFLTLPKQAIDPAYDPAQDNEVSAERQAAAAAATALTAAEAAQTPVLAKLVELWDLAVPPELAGTALRASAATDHLATLSHVDAGVLLGRLDEADDDFADAVQRQLHFQDLQDAADAELAARLAAGGGEPT